MRPARKEPELRERAASIWGSILLLRCEPMAARSLLSCSAIRGSFTSPDQGLQPWSANDYPGYGVSGTLVAITGGTVFVWGKRRWIASCSPRYHFLQSTSCDATDCLLHWGRPWRPSSSRRPLLVPRLRCPTPSRCPTCRCCPSLTTRRRSSTWDGNSPAIISAPSCAGRSGIRSQVRPAGHSRA